MDDTLHIAAGKGRLQEVEALLRDQTAESKAKLLDQKDDQKWRALHHAAFEGHAKVVDYLIKAGANIRAEYHDDGSLSDNDDEDDDDLDICCPTALHLAAFANHTPVMELLINAGAKVNRLSSLDMPHAFDSLFLIKASPLHFAAAKGACEAIKLLISKGANLNAKDFQKQTPLHFATENGHLAAMQLLLEAGANPNCIGNGDLYQAPLHAAVEIGSQEMVQLLLKHNADINILDFEGKAPIHYALSLKGTAIAQLLIKAGADLNLNGISDVKSYCEAAISIGEEYCGVPLGWAITADNEEMTRLILEYSPSVNSWEDEESRNGVLPIHVAAENGSLNAAKMLIEAGAEVNARTVNGWTPLLYASNYIYEGRSLAMAKILLDAGARLGAKSKKKGRTELHYACKKGNFELCQLLIEAGAHTDVNAQDIKGSTPMHLLFKDYHKDEVFENILNLLLKHGANVASGCPVDKKGNTPLHLALEMANLKTIIYLVNAGASPEVRNKKGDTPMESLRIYSQEYNDLENESRIDRVEHFGSLTVFQRGSGIGQYQEWTGLCESDAVRAAALIAGGSREWNYLPTPCHGLEIALHNVWEQTPDDLPTLFGLLKQPVKKSIQDTLRCLHHYLPGQKEIHMEILGNLFSIKG